MTFISDIYIYVWEQKLGGERVVANKLIVNVQVYSRLPLEVWQQNTEKKLINGKNGNALLAVFLNGIDFLWGGHGDGV